MNQAADGANVSILALGSPHGDDRAAWEVAARLQRDPALAPVVTTIATPWDVLEHLRPGMRCLILDACRAGAPVGTVVERREDDLAGGHRSACSTHGGELADVLRMARALGRSAEEIVVLAVEIGDPEPGAQSAGPEMSGPVERALARLEQAARANLSRWRGIDYHAHRGPAGSRTSDSLD